MNTKKKRLFYDIETSYCEGTFWRPGYNQTIHPNQVLRHAQIICISWKWEGSKKIHHLHWGLEDQCDKKMLTEFIKILDQANEIVAHNGDRFDIKWIRTRAAYHGLEMRFKYNTIDTLKLCKAYLNLPSNSLAQVAKYFHLEAKLDPGGLETWIDVVRDKDKKALKKMLWYCDGDIRTLEAVYNKIRPYVKPSLNYGVLHGGNNFSCPECGNLSRWNKTYTTTAGTIQHYMKCRDSECRTVFKINNKTYQDYLNYKMINGIK